MRFLFLLSVVKQTVALLLYLRSLYLAFGGHRSLLIIAGVLLLIHTRHARQYYYSKKLHNEQ